MWPFSSCPQNGESQSGEVKNIIVIGASFAGHTLVNALASKLPTTHRILLVERNEFVLHAPTVVRAVVVPGWEDKNITARLTQESVFPSDSRHRVLCPNTVTELRRDSIIVEQPFEGSTEISFDKCVIATGAQQPLPMRPKANSTLEEYKTILREIQTGIKGAKKIAVIGGGTVGVETVGEINHLYPEKDVTIIHGGSGLLNPKAEMATESDVYSYNVPPTPETLSTSLQQQLEARGVKLVLSDRVVFPKGDIQPGQWDGRTGTLDKEVEIPLASGKTILADYVFLASGNKPNSQLVEATDPSALTKGGFIAVNQYFRVQPKSKESVLAGEYYALGDVANVPGNKTAVTAADQGQALASVIGAEVRGSRPTQYTPAGMTASMVVTLGEGAGAGVLFLPFVGQVSAPGIVLAMKSKDFFAGKSFYSRFKGPEAVAA